MIVYPVNKLYIKGMSNILMPRNIYLGFPGTILSLTNKSFSIGH